MDVGVIKTGSVEYSKTEAATPIEDMIAMLTDAQDEGVTHVVLSSGNYRGAKYMRVYAECDF